MRIVVGNPPSHVEGTTSGMADTMKEDVLEMTAQIVAAHVGHNVVKADALPALIKSVYQSLTTVGTAEVDPAPSQTPAVPIKKSVFPDFIICLEDGKKLKVLKRHLRVSYNMTPEEYRVKWNLPRDYPMVAPAYTNHRSTLAKKSGLGRKVAVDPLAKDEVTREAPAAETPAHDGQPQSETRSGKPSRKAVTSQTGKDGNTRTARAR